MNIERGELSDARFKQYQPVLRFLERVAKQEGIAITVVQIHDHKAGSCGSDAEADMEAMAIELCGAWDRATALHELAHLIVIDNSTRHHTRQWAVKVMELNEKYLPAARAERANRRIALDHNKARHLYRQRTGKRIPRNVANIAW
jgi:hypothetical protein